MATRLLPVLCFFHSLFGQGLEFRNLGPATMGGRISDIHGAEAAMMLYRGIHGYCYLRNGALPCTQHALRLPGRPERRHGFRKV